MIVNAMLSLSRTGPRHLAEFLIFQLSLVGFISLVGLKTSNHEPIHKSAALFGVSVLTLNSCPRFFRI